MSTTAPLPKAEAKVMSAFSENGGRDWTEWADSVGFDPIMLPVEVTIEGQGPLTTDAFEANLLGLMDAICAIDDGVSAQYRLVWSANGHDVKATCPRCDDVFIVSEGFPGDELNEGYNAVCCGCEPEDENETDALWEDEDEIDEMQV